MTRNSHTKCERSNGVGGAPKEGLQCPLGKREGGQGHCTEDLA